MEYLPILLTLLPFFSAWLDSRKLTGDIPQKVIDNVAKSIEIREKDIEYLTKKSIDDEETKIKLHEENNRLNQYIDYLLQWIKKHKPKRAKAPDVLETFLQQSQ